MNMAPTPRLAFVVDDVEGNRLLAEAYLERIGWTVRTYNDAQAVLAALDQELPEAMLIDIRMPGLRGDQLAALLRQSGRTSGIRLVGYTAQAMPDEIAGLRDAGFDEVLIKPIKLADMTRVLPLGSPAA